MKRILVFLSLVCFTGYLIPKAQAQVAAPSLKTTFSGSKTIDTTTAVADSVKFVFAAGNMKNGSITCRGTIVNGSPIVTGLLQVSADGLYWDTRQPVLQQNGDTINLTPTAGTNSVAEKSLAIPANNHSFYRVLLLNHTAADMKIGCYVTSRRD